MSTPAVAQVTGLNLGRVPRRAVVILSGGLDSTVLAYGLHAAGVEMAMLSFDYGQRHRRELGSASATGNALGVGHRIVDLSAVSALLAVSSLTDDAVAVPDGHYSDVSMRATVVPNRNALMLDVATAHAVSIGADAVMFGAHAGDHPIYPDCRPAFVSAYESMVRLANEGFIAADFAVMAPFLTWSKAAIVGLGARLGVPFADTWSCYKGAEWHCGTCGTCVERREAFELAGIADPTVYHEVI